MHGKTVIILVSDPNAQADKAGAAVCKYDDGDDGRTISCRIRKRSQSEKGKVEME